MADRRNPLGDSITEYAKAAGPPARALARRLRDELETLAARIPRSVGAEPAASPFQPADRSTSDVEALKERLRNRPVPSPRSSGTGTVLAELRDAAEPLLDGTEEGDSDRHVVIAALNVLAKVQEVVIRELGHDWRGKVRPFGALARRRGTQVGAAWVGDTASGVEPITLADAVELLAIDRAQFRREADESRTSAGQSVAQGRDALQRAATAQRQVVEIRRLLDETLRPNAHTAEWCDTCQDEGVDGCEDHRDDDVEPALSADLADEVKRVIELWRDAQAEAHSAAHGRVSVYVDGELMAGPDVASEAVPEPAPPTPPPRLREVRRTERRYPQQPAGESAPGDRHSPGRTWAESLEARDAVHLARAGASRSVCMLPLGNGEDYRAASTAAAVTCGRCLLYLDGE